MSEDERTFRRLVEPHRRALEIHAYRMLGSPHDAEDVVQETLQRARATIDPQLAARRTRPAPGATRELLRRYVDAFESADVDGLVALLREDAIIRMPPQPSIVGALGIARFLAERQCGGPGDIT